MKVIGGNWFGTHRMICACKSRAELSRITKLPIKYLSDYFCETGNAEEIKIATGAPKTVFIKLLRHEGEWTVWKATGS